MLENCDAKDEKHLECSQSNPDIVELTSSKRNSFTEGSTQQRYRGDFAKQFIEKGGELSPSQQKEYERLLNEVRAEKMGKKITKSTCASPRTRRSTIDQTSQCEKIERSTAYSNTDQDPCKFKQRKFKPVRNGDYIWEVLDTIIGD